MRILGYCVAVKLRIGLRQRKKMKNHVLDEIKQEYTVKDLVGKPIVNRELASIASNLFLNNMEEEKPKDLNKKHSRPENCPNMATSKCNSEIWKSNLTSTHIMNEIELQ